MLLAPLLSCAYAEAFALPAAFGTEFGLCATCISLASAARFGDSGLETAGFAMGCDWGDGCRCWLFVPVAEGLGTLLVIGDFEAGDAVFWAAHS